MASKHHGLGRVRWPCSWLELHGFLARLAHIMMMMVMIEVGRDVKTHR